MNKKSSASRPTLHNSLKNGSIAALLLPLTFAALAGLCAVVGSTAPVVVGANRGMSGAFSIALTLLPLLVALGFAARTRLVAAAGILVGLAALTPGLVLLDLQFLVDPSATSRPDLYLPASLDRPGPDLGLWLLLLGHLCAVAAGVLAFRWLRRRTDLSDSGLSSGSNSASPSLRWRVLAVVLVGILVAIGLLLAPFSSTDVYLLALPAAQAPALVLAGTLVLAGAVPLAAVLALTVDLEFAQGCLFALGLGLLAEALPSLLAGSTMRGLGVSAGPILVLVGVLFLILIALWPRHSESAARSADTPTAEEIALPGLRRLEVITGTLGLMTALCCLLGALTPQVISTIRATDVQSPDRWWLLTAGVLVALLSLGLFLPRLASWVRPMFSVVWVSVLLTGFAVLDTAVVSAEVSGVFTSGSGVIWTAVAMVLAMVSACASLITGMVERENAVPDEDVEFASEISAMDGPRQRPISLSLMVFVILVAALTIVGFGLPVISAPNYLGAGLFTSFTTPVWGLLVALLTLLGALLVVIRARPASAVGLLVGCLLIMGLRLVEPTLLGNAVEGAKISGGWWVSLVCLVVLAVGVSLAMTQTIRARNSSHGPRVSNAR